MILRSPLPTSHFVSAIFYKSLNLKIKPFLFTSLITKEIYVDTKEQNILYIDHFKTNHILSSTFR